MRWLLVLCLVFPLAESVPQEANVPAPGANENGEPEISVLAWVAGIVAFVVIFGIGIGAEIESKRQQTPEHMGGGLYVRGKSEDDGLHGCGGCGCFVVGLAAAFYIANSLDGWLGAN